MSGVMEAASMPQLKEVFQRTQLTGAIPENLLEDLLPSACLMNYMPEDVILRQGEVNTNLYFLILGDIEIVVDGGRVNSLKAQGDLVGEMSVITGAPCSATIQAQTPVQLLCIDTEKLKSTMGPRQSEFDALLFRIYSQILAEKLNQTNQKAKRLESTMEALSKAKTEIQEVHRSMELRVAERITGLKRSLEGLLDSHLEPLQKTMKSLLPQIPEKEKSAYSKCMTELNNAIRTVEPIASSISSELSVKNKKVLVANSVKKNILTSKMALGGTGVHLETAGTPAEAKEHLTAHQFDLVLLDHEHIPLIEYIYTAQKSARVVYTASGNMSDYKEIIKTLGASPNVVAGNEDDRALMIRNIMTTVSKIASQSVFGLEKYLNWGVDVQELPVENSAQRETLKEKMCEYFDSLSVRKSILENVSLVVEEMLMNAIYDAPVDAQGASKYNQLSRQEKVILPLDEQSRFRFASDGTFAAVSVEDPFGALTADTIFKYLASCYEGRAGEFNKEKGGAGRGLHQIIENSTLVVFNVAPGKRTEVIALFYIVPGDKAERNPQFHYFTA